MTTRGWAVVTGASAGIGLEIARVLAARGHDLVLVARRAQALESLAAQLQDAHGVSTHVAAVDLGARDGADRLAHALSDAGIVPTVLVNNAGIGVYGRHIDNAPDDVQALIDLNISALTRLTRLLLPAMLQAGHGRILNVASTAAFQPGPGMAVYFASKAYVLSYSEALAQELVRRGITVTALCPGPTRSEFFDRADMHRATLAQGRLPSAREVAEYGVHAMERGQRVAIHGLKNRLLVFATRFAPRNMVSAMASRFTRPT